MSNNTFLQNDSNVKFTLGGDFDGNNNGNNNGHNNGSEEKEVNFQSQLYTNTGYRNDRNNVQLVILDSKDISAATRADNYPHSGTLYTLPETLVIDSPTDVYLEYLQLQNVDMNGVTIENTPVFCIDIPELDIKTVSNNEYFTNKFVINNESFGETDTADNDTITANGARTYHIRLKSNFVSTIQPKKLKNFHVSITGRVAKSDSGVSGIRTLNSNDDNNSFTGKFTNYTLDNLAANLANSYNTCGAVKIALLFKKREKWNEQILKLQNQNYSDLIYKNTQYFNDRSNYQIVVLDSAMCTTTVSVNGSTKNSRDQFFYFQNVKFKLLDDLVIDTKTEVYLEFLSFNNQFVMYDPSSFDGTPTDTTDCRDHLEATSAFYIDIPQLKLKTYTNNEYAIGKYILPNEIYGKTDPNPNDDNTDVTAYNIRLKRNFMGIIEPTKIREFTMSITADDFQKSSDSSTYYYMGNRLETANAGNMESSVQIALLLKKVW